MLKYIMFLIVLINFSTRAQTWSIFAGQNLSKAIWSPNYSLVNSDNYKKGYVIGIGFKAQKKGADHWTSTITPQLELSYSTQQVSAYIPKTDNSSYKTHVRLQKLQLAVPFSANLTPIIFKHLRLKGAIAPIYNITIDDYYNTSDVTESISDFTDFSTAFKFIIDYHFQGNSNRYKRSKSKKYTLSGLALTFSKQLDLSPSLENKLGSGNINIYQVNLALYWSTRKDRIRNFGKQSTFSEMF